MRILMVCLSKIKATEPLSHLQEFTISVEELKEHTKNRSKANYDYLRKAADDLMNMQIKINLDPDGEVPDTPYKKINLVDSCDYVPNEGMVKLKFGFSIIPFISDLKTKFTQYLPKHVMPMRSVYGIRLYELCISWIGDVRDIPVAEFRSLLGLQGSTYDRIDNLKARVIVPALKDINQYTNLRVSYTQRKSGRTVVAFLFHITRLPDADSVWRDLTVRERKIYDAWVEKHSGPGESWDEARDRLWPQWQTEQAA